MSNLCITSFNIRSLGGANIYLNSLLKHYDSDILFLSEHRLYKDELFKLDSVNDEYSCSAKASSDLNSSKQSHVIGHCGVAMFWKKSLCSKVRVVDCESDS